MRFDFNIAKKLSGQGFDISFPESDLIPAIYNIVLESFPEEPKQVRFIMNDPDFIGDVLGELENV